MKFEQSTHFTPGQLLYIRWEDASGCPAGWSDGEEHVHLDPADVKSVGYVHRVGDRFVSLTPHVCSTQEDELVAVMGMMSIPFSCILEWHELNVPGGTTAVGLGSLEFLERANESLQAINDVLSEDMAKLQRHNNTLFAEVSVLRAKVSELLFPKPAAANNA